MMKITKQMIDRAYASAKKRGFFKCKVIHQQSMSYICPSCNGTGEIPKEKQIQNQILDIIGEVIEARDAFNTGIEPDMDRYNGHILLTGFPFSSTLYKDAVKNTFPDELADIVIGCYTLAGMLGIEEIVLSINNENYTIYSLLEVVFSSLNKAIKNVNERKIVGTWLGLALGQTYAFAKHHKIDLDKFIELKMSYNEVRED